MILHISLYCLVKFHDSVVMTVGLSIHASAEIRRRRRRLMDFHFAIIGRGHARQKEQTELRAKIDVLPSAHWLLMLPLLHFSGSHHFLGESETLNICIPLILEPFALYFPLWSILTCCFSERSIFHSTPHLLDDAVILSLPHYYRFSIPGRSCKADNTPLIDASLQPSRTDISTFRLSLAGIVSL